MEGKGQRWAASLKNEAERARAELEEESDRKVVGEGFETVPGRKSVMVAGRRVREAQAMTRMIRRASNAVATEENEKALPQPLSHFSWSSVGQKSSPSFRQRMSVMMHKMQVLTLPKSHSSRSSRGRASPTLISYIVPKRMAILHAEGGELWNIVGEGSSMVPGNKGSRRPRYIVNRRDSDSH